MEPQRRAQIMRNAARARARKKGQPFDLPLEWFIDRLTRGRCEATGLPFVWQPRVLHQHRENSFAPSTERLDSSLGYTVDNCIMTVWVYNRAKSAGVAADVMRMAHALVRADGLSVDEIVRLYDVEMAA
jgi:hypothetical protein